MKAIGNNNYSIPNNLYSTEAINILEEIIDSGKEIPVNLMIGILKPKWKKIKDSITISRKPLEKIQEYKDVRFIIDYALKKEEIVNKINRLIFELQGQEKIENDEREEKLNLLLDKVKSSLYWYKDNWISYIGELKGYIANLDDQKINLQVDNPIEYICDLTNDYLALNINNYHTSLKLEEEVQRREEYLDRLKTYVNRGLIFNKLIDAVEIGDIDSYAYHHKELSEIYAKNEMNIRRHEILEKLAKYAPEWANTIKDREGIHGDSKLPDDIELAWKWRQLTNQLDRIDSYDPDIIQKDIIKINKLLMNNARDLAYEKAWYKKIINNTAEQTQAIEGWRQTMRLIGKGTGKQAPKLRERARQLMPLCQSAIPVWIMPLNRVAENFDPSKNEFDVIIIDEASQADILALSVLYLGKKIIIVGDDEQVSPEAVGIKTDEEAALIEQHLQGITINHLFSGRTSIYDMAKTSGFKPIMLVEHFRCIPEIIEFSNQLSYNGKIKPLRDSSGVSIKPAVLEYRVPNGYINERKVNHLEAEHIASLVCACIEDENYKGKTIGVITLLGNRQAIEIDRILQTRLDPKDYEDRRIQCGSSAQFQGDERDIIFLSVVDSPKEGGGPLRLMSQDGNNDINRKRYNVAASRAKDQMWVVHSLNPEIDLKPEDIRLRLIKYSMNPVIDRDSELLKKAESDFELKVMTTLLNKGYKVYSQWPVGAYRIDMVVEDGDNRIALECDGERWHTQDDLSKDLKRQAILERLGWRFIRIRGSAYYRNPDKTMDWLYSELESYNIKPNFLAEAEDMEERVNIDSELVDRIKLRAMELRMQWNGKTEVDDEDIIEVSVGYDEESNTVPEQLMFNEGSFIETENDEVVVNIKDFKSTKSKETEHTKKTTKASSKKQESSEEKIETDDIGAIARPMFDFRKGSKG
ncbi:DUF559 domain-containing protein [Tissierella creatinini]|nr:DUF559 domain-containing protein [Tissierella creatinini]TJX63238.1 DUF559 domain-containing protein [Soehngenia saccharolytica]